MAWVILLGVGGSLFIGLVHGGLTVNRRRGQLRSQWILGLANAIFTSPETRFPNAQLIEVAICQECGYGGPLGQVCPRCGQSQKERQRG
jgi:hypothetical protein